MFRLGAALNVPVVSNVVAFKMEGRVVTAECKMDAGSIGVIRMPLPCIIGAGKALNKPRYPTLPDIMKARKKPIRTISFDSLELDSPAGSMAVVELRPAVEKRWGKIIGSPPEKAVQELVELLREEAKVI
jgi:electron transfer flavoprotein beta subunit